MRILAAAIVIIALAFLIAASIAQPAPTSRPCIALDLTLHTYDGPIVIDGACVDFLSSIQNPPSLRLIAHDNSDGIFRNSFETTP